jgi:hypothetical protein
MIQTFHKGKQLSIMVWAAFSIESGRSELVIMERDEMSKRGGYSSRSYHSVLMEHLPTIWEPGLMFMQDNAPIHMARIITNWFRDSGIPLMQHPPYSPDLNPIEHVWKKLKETIYQMHPELLECTGETEEDWNKLCEAIIEAWNAIPWSFFITLAETMQNRCLAVQKAEGWQTKY